MQTEWYCVIGGERRGPLVWEDLTELVRCGELGSDDLVWEPAFGTEWRTAGTVEGLCDDVAAADLEPDGRNRDAAPTPLLGVPGTRPHFGAAMAESWHAMKQMLFKPFDLGRWFSLGFCAWLAAIGSGGCSGASFPDKNMLKHWKSNPEAGAGTLLQDLQTQYRTFMDAHPGVAAAIVAVVVVTVVVVVAWALLATWLRSRGAFMLVHRWHQPDDTVSQSWAAGRELGRSLFLWRIVFGALMALLMAGLTGAVVITVVLPFVHLRALPPGGWLWLLGLGSGLLLVVSCWGTVGLLLDAFVVPVMYWRRVGVLAAWRVVLAFCNEQPVALLVYLLLWPLLVLAGVLIFGLVVLGSCCLLCLPLMLPYVNQVAMLPLTVFYRGVGICFVRQWRPDLQAAGAAGETRHG